MPTDELTESGLTILTSSARFDQITAEIRAGVDPLVDLSADKPTGQLARILNDHIQRNAELLQAINTALDPDQASGLLLRAIATITGTKWKPATQGSVLLKVTLDGGTTLPAGSQAWSQLSEDTTVTTDVDVVAPAGPSDDYEVTATVVAYGAIEIPAGVIKDIKTPVSGWTAVINDADGTPGTEAETDQELRDRREEEVSLGGSTSVDAIKAQLSALSGMLQVIVLENDLWISQDGIPPKSIEPVVWDGGGVPPAVSDAIIAATIFSQKAGGIQSYGSTTADHTDTQGNTHKIGFTRALERVVELEYTIITGTGYPGNDAFKAAIAGWADANLRIGDDVIASRFEALAFCLVAGVTDITNFRLRFYGDSWGTTNLSVGSREIATVDTTGITVG